jgi:hypothetical protein
MGLEDKYIRAAVIILEIIKIIRDMVKVLFIGIMVKSILANLLMISKRVMENMNSLMVVHIKVITLKVIDTVKEHSDGLTARQKKKNILMEKK